MKTQIKYLLISSLLLFSIFLVNEDSFSITDTLRATKDNTLYENEFGLLSNGKGQYMFAGTTAGVQIRRGIISFGVNDFIPPGAVITGVKLVMHMSKTIALSKRVKLHRVTKNWGEGNSDAFSEEGGGAASDSADATWVHNFYNTDYWSSPGGDYSAVESGQTNVYAIGFYTWTDPQMIADVQNWVNNVSPDFGWIIVGDESELATAKRFDTREHPDVTVRPKLIVTYTFNYLALKMKALTEGLTYNGSIVPDTFKVYLRNSFSPYSVIDSTATYNDYESWYVFNNASPGLYYIEVNQRNSINTWSKLPQSFTAGLPYKNYNFTTAATQAYGNNLILIGSNYCFYSGDVNKDNNINLTDVLLVYNAATIFQTGYVVTDVTGNNIVDLTDLLITYNNSTKFIIEQRP